MPSSEKDPTVTPTQADLDNLTAAITSLESHPADALAGHAEHLNGLRGRLAVLHTAAQEAATARDRERVRPFEESVLASLAPTNAPTRRVYQGGGL